MIAQIGLNQADIAPLTEGAHGLKNLIPDLAYLRLSIVNVVFYGAPSADGWVLIDTGLSSSAAAIIRAAQSRFGNQPPDAIILTHGHFDHVGSVVTLAEHWNVPVFAHPLEHPYLDGSAAYPPADPWVGGGLVALMSPLFPRSPVDLGARLGSLPDDKTVPGMPGWRWIHAPGHSPGQICLWREKDGSLISADAIITTGQESAYEVLNQTPEIHGPPRYFTIDWMAAEQSVQQLAKLDVQRIISGHGPALSGPGMRAALDHLAANFKQTAVPPSGKYVRRPASAGDGSAYRSP